MNGREGIERVHRLGHPWMWILILVLTGWTQGPSVKDLDDVALRQVGAALEAGDAEALLTGAARQIAVTLDGKTAMYSRAQARYVMRAFFSRRPPSRFVFGNVRRSSGQAEARGTYWSHRTRGGHDVYIRLRWKNGRWQLRALHIEMRIRRWGIGSE